VTYSRSYPDNVEAIRHALHSAIDSPVIEALARLFHPNILVVGNSYSESVMDILAPRLIAELGSVSVAQTAQVFEEPRNVTAADREYASELLADLTSYDLPRLEIAARWFRKARVEHSLPGNHAQSSQEAREKEITRLATIEECAQLIESGAGMADLIDQYELDQQAEYIRALALPSTDRGGK